MTEPDDREDTDDLLAHALMAAVTGRLEDLAALSIELHTSLAPAAALKAGVSDVLILLAARDVLANREAEPDAS